MPDVSGWITAAACVVGVKHVRAGLPNQDNYALRCGIAGNGESTLIVAVSDGAGSASHSQIGALVAVQAFVDYIAGHMDEGMGLAGLARAAFHGICRAVSLRAASEGRAKDDYACTLIGAIIEENAACCIQIGDGLMAWRGAETPWQLAVAPQRGEYANETYFLTQDDAAARVEIWESPVAVRQLALLTDGLQHQALDADDAVAARFFDPLFVALEANAHVGDVALSEALKRFLSSPAVNACTDDDKTLVLISRTSLR